MDNNVSKHYNEITVDRFQKYTDPIQREYYYRLIDWFVLEFLPDDPVRILDVGTGTGRMAVVIQLEETHNHEVIGIDMATDAVHAADNHHHTGDTTFVIGDGLQLPFEGESIDVVLSMGAFEHVNDLDPFLMEFKRVLKADGRFVAEFFNRGSPFVSSRRTDGGFNRSLQKPDDVMKKLVKHGFSVLDMDYTYYLTRPQKYLIRSSRFPAGLRRLSNDISMTICEAARKLPVLRQYGGMFLTAAEVRQ